MTDLGADSPDLLSGRYELGDVIGRGGMGVVHRAWDQQLHRYVAIKILRDLAMDPIGRARFRAEGETLARLGHPGLITLFDAQTDGDEPFLVMELVDGEPLTELCRGQAMAVGEVTRIGATLAEALDHVHRRRIIHRDIKPSNVLIGRDGRVKLADFGVARLLDAVTRHTATGVTMGTAAYLAPEQVRGEAVTAAADIYSLGLVLIEALCGVPAFTGSWDVVALARLTSSPPIDPAWPGPLRSLLAAMTAADPARRPSAAQVARALGAATPGAATGSQPAGSLPAESLPGPLSASRSAASRLPSSRTDASASAVTDPGAGPALPGHSTAPDAADTVPTASSRGRWARVAGLVAVTLVAAILLGSQLAGTRSNSADPQTATPTTPAAGSAFSTPGSVPTLPTGSAAQTGVAPFGAAGPASAGAATPGPAGSAGTAGSGAAGSAGAPAPAPVASTSPAGRSAAEKAKAERERLAALKKKAKAAAQAAKDAQKAAEKAAKDDKAKGNSGKS